MTKASRGRARIGVLVPFTNTNLEPDLIMACPSGVSLHFARMGGYDVDAVPDDTQMAQMGEAPIDEPLRMLAGARPDVVLYGCTSATLTHGVAFDRTLAKQIEAQTGAKTVTAAGALVHALKSLGIKNIGFTSPYVAAINAMAIDFLAGAGIRTVSSAEVGEALGNYGQSALTPDDVYDLALRADSRDAEAVVLSCTDMRALEAVSRLEATLAKPVITSNQAMLFEASQHLAIPSQEINYGQLFREKIHA